MLVRSSVNLPGGIFSSEVKSVDLARQSLSKLSPRSANRQPGDFGQTGMAALFSCMRASGAASTAAARATIGAARNGPEPAAREPGGDAADESDQLLLAAACQAAYDAIPAEAADLADFPRQNLLEEIGKIDLIRLLGQRPQPGQAPCSPEKALALSVVSHLAASAEGAALALRLTRQDPQLRLPAHPALERHVQKLAMYFFRADLFRQRHADPNQATHANLAMAGIRNLMQNALAGHYSGRQAGSPILFGEEIRRLAPAEAMAVAALRNDLWLDDATPDSLAVRRRHRIGDLLGGVHACLWKMPSADETACKHFKRVAGKIIGGKIDTAMTALKYLRRERTAPNLTRRALDTYLALNQIVSSLERRLGMAGPHRSVAAGQQQTAPSPSRHNIPDSSIHFASYRLAQAPGSAPPGSAGPGRAPAPGRVAPGSRPAESQGDRSTRPALRLSHLDLDMPQHRKYLDLYGRLLVLRKQKEYIGKFIGNLPASMGTEYLQNRSLGDDVVDAMLNQPDLQGLAPNVLATLKGIVQKYNRLGLHPETLDTWLRQLQARRQSATGMPPVERLTRVKAMGIAQTRERLKTALRQLAGELHFGKQFALSSASGHLASTKGILPVFTGGVFDVFAELAYSKGMKFTIGNNSTGSFLEVKWTGLRSADVGVNVGLPLIANPVFGASLGLDGNLSGQGAEGIIFRFSRDASFHSDLANNARLADLLAFLVDGDAAAASPPQGRTALMALLERFPDISIGHVTESKTKGSLGLTGSLSIGPKIPRVAIGATANAGLSATREFSDRHAESDGHNCRTTSRRAWVISASATGGARTGINLAGLIHPATSQPASGLSAREIGAQAADNIVRANRFMGTHVGIALNLRGYAEEYAEHIKDGQVQANTSWRTKTFFTRDTYLSHLRECSGELIDAWSRTVTLLQYGNLDSDEAKWLYAERREAHAAWLQSHIAKVQASFEANTTYTMNYDLRPEVAKRINQCRAAQSSLLKLGNPEKARQYGATIRQLMQDSRSYVFANILVNRAMQNGKERSLGLVAYGTHVAKAEEQTFNFYGPIANKNIVLPPPAPRQAPGKVRIVPGASSGAPPVSASCLRRKSREVCMKAA